MNTDPHTVSVIWATGNPVRRQCPLTGAVFFEVLDMTGCDMTRLQSGAAPVLSVHCTGRMDSIVGRVLSAEITDGIGRAQVLLSRRRAVRELVNEVLTGMVCGISVGYAVDYAEPDRSGEIDVHHVRRWTAMEFSVVPVAADPACRVIRP